MFNRERALGLARSASQLANVFSDLADVQLFFKLHIQQALGGPDETTLD
jgi:hypothetical protein